MADQGLESVATAKYFSFEIDGAPAEFTPLPDRLAPNVLPNPIGDADGTLTPTPAIGTASGVFAGAANSWHDGNAFQFLFVVEPTHQVPVDAFAFFDQTSPGGPTDWLLKINGQQVATGRTHNDFMFNLESLSLPPLEGTTLFEIVGTGATDPAAIWAIDDVAVGTLVPEPSSLAIMTTALGAFLWKRFRRKRTWGVSSQRRSLTPTPRLAVLVSDSGRTLMNLAMQIKRGKLDAKIDLVICSNPETGGVRLAQRLGLPVKVMPRKQHSGKRSYSRAIFDSIRSTSPDLVCLAGFLPILEIPSDYERRVLNIHPSLLPDFGGKGMYGHHVHEAVLSAGARETGCTVHYCDDEIDHGPVVVQRRCPVLPRDTPRSLDQRVFELGCLAYPKAIQLAAATVA